jgi:hypothetical protein
MVDFMFHINGSQKKAAHTENVIAEWHILFYKENVREADLNKFPLK